MDKYNAPQGAPPSYPQQAYQGQGSSAGYYNSPPPPNQGPYGPPAQYGQPAPMQYGQQGYPPQPYPQQGYAPQQGYPPPQGGYYGQQRGSSGEGICAGIMGACACCLCLDCLI